MATGGSVTSARHAPPTDTAVSTPFPAHFIKSGMLTVATCTCVHGCMHVIMTQPFDECEFFADATVGMQCSLALILIVQVQGRQSSLRARARKRLRTNSARSAPTYNLANRRCCWRGRGIRGSRQTHFSCRPHTSYHKSQNGTFWAHCSSCDGGNIGQRVCVSDGCGASDVLVVRCVRRQAQVHGEQGLRFDIRRRELPWLWQLDGEGPVTPIVLS
jgi:hypothetical protein